MIYFSTKCQKFLSDLEINNNRDWFNANKEIYKREVEEPFHKLVTDLIIELKKLDSKINITSKEAVFRIYRDVRFSKDKSPYKNYVSAVIGQGGRKEMEKPGMYFELQANAVKIFSGIYMPAPKTLEKIRKTIAKDPKAFQKLYKEKKFASNFGQILGEKNKVIPKELKAAAEREPYIYNKAFYYSCELPEELITSKKLLSEIVKTYKTALPLSNFLSKCIVR